VPLVQRLPVGFTENVPPSLEPQMPLTAVGARLAVQLATLPPFIPVHVQYQGPDPIKPEAVPLVQKLVAGATENTPLLLVPHKPLVCEADDRLKLVQPSSVPPLLPKQLQFHGPLPVTLPAEPVVQRFVVGAAATVCPLLLPQEPLTGVAAVPAVSGINWLIDVPVGSRETVIVPGA
jgi:hypothetical protein